MIEFRREAAGRRDDWAEALTVSKEHLEDVPSISSQQLSPKADAQVQAVQPLNQYPEPDMSTSKSPDPNSLLGIIERSRSRSTASLLVENCLVTACAATLCSIISADIRDLVQGILAQPPVVNIGGILPLTAIFTFPPIFVALWSCSGVTLIERGWKALQRKFNAGEG